MVKEEKAVNSNINTNNITNNINVDVKAPKRTYKKRKSNSNWFVKAVIGGIITFVTSLIIYYNTNSNQTHKPPGVDDNSNAISGVKQ